MFELHSPCCNTAIVFNGYYMELECPACRTSLDYPDIPAPCGCRTETNGTHTLNVAETDDQDASTYDMLYPVPVGTVVFFCTECGSFWKSDDGSLLHMAPIWKRREGFNV